MAEIRVGPLLRHVGQTDATVWVETDQACEVDVLGCVAPTFEVEDHHFAIVCIEGLDPYRQYPYEVRLDGEVAWPPPGYEFPQPRIRLVPPEGSLRLAFGSCRTSAPQRMPYTLRGLWHPKGRGVDALRAFGTRMLAQPSALWPDALLMLGDQLYADDVPDDIKQLVAGREVHADGPVEVLEDFEEYCIGYRDAWTEPMVRWILSTLPTSMIFDDHEINDRWNISAAWLAEKRRTSWYETRILGGLMAYWVYQHLGNLTPGELADNPTLQEIRRTRDGTAALRRMARDAESDEGRSRFSFCRDFGSTRLLVVDSRTGRQLGAGRRRITTEDEWDWVSSRVDGDYRNLIIASSLPFLMPSGVHDIEGWSEAVADGAWGRRLRALGEQVRMKGHLDHWAVFQRSFRDVEDLVIDSAAGRLGAPPESIVLLGGDVHHCWVTEVSLPGEAAPAPTKVWQVVCSGLRKDLALGERLLQVLGHTRAATALGRALARAARVPRPRLRWREATGLHFRNQIGTLEIAGQEVGVRLEEVSGALRKPARLHTVVEHKLR
ncbi:MAG: alkaline phosphatase D family protein [Actinomycetota bacterium]|nr:alkaline phosphatase D family protein [Actinomycetota bacterium]